MKKINFKTSSLEWAPTNKKYFCQFFLPMETDEATEFRLLLISCFLNICGANKKFEYTRTYKLTESNISTIIQYFNE